MNILSRKAPVTTEAPPSAKVTVTISISKAAFADTKDITLASHETLDDWHAPYLPNIGDTYVSPTYAGLSGNISSYVGVVEKISHHQYPNRLHTTIWCRQMID